MLRKHTKGHTHTHGIFAKFEILMQINIQKFQARILLKNMNERAAFII